MRLSRSPVFVTLESD